MSGSPLRHAPSAGYTILEAFCVLLISGILLAILVPVSLRRLGLTEAKGSMTLNPKVEEGANPTPAPFPKVGPAGLPDSLRKLFKDEDLSAPPPSKP
jgi:hypothetical protein